MMKNNLGLIISDNNNCAFKSKTPKESHSVFGKSIRQWSAEALKEVAENNREISYTDIDVFKELVSQSDQVFINWADQPLILSDTFKQLSGIHITEEHDATAIFGSNGIAAIYAFKSSILLDQINRLNVPELSRKVLSQIFQSIENTSKSVYEDKNQFVVVEDRIALSKVALQIKSRIINNIMLSGVTVVDPGTTYIDAGVKIGLDTVIMPNTIIEGDTSIGEDCIIGPSSRMSGCKIGNNVEFANSVAFDSSVGDETHVGPFAYLRPGSSIGSKVKIGDFVEIKKSMIGDRTKISHLTYVGDAEIGKNVNIGCGVVVVNYDGKHKNKTVVGDNSFIGCNTNLVSPVVVHQDAYIAAGSTITDDVPEDSLAIARERQVVKTGWVSKKGLKRE